MKSYETVEDLPDGPLAAVPSVVNTGSWRTFRPVIDREACTKCYVCWKFCPDVAISLDTEGWPVVALEACKGCGVCSQECKPKAITMVEEESL